MQHIAAGCQKLLQAFLFITHGNISSAGDIFNPLLWCLCSTYLHADFGSLLSWHLTDDKAQINWIVTVSINFPQTLTSKRSFSTLVSFMSLSPSFCFHFLCSMSHPCDTSVLFALSCLTSQNSKHACLLPLRQENLEGWSSEDDVLFSLHKRYNTLSPTV